MANPKDAYSISALITNDNMERLIFLKEQQGTTFSRTINTALALFFQEHAELGLGTEKLSAQSTS